MRLLEAYFRLFLCICIICIAAYNSLYLCYHYCRTENLLFVYNSKAKSIMCFLQIVSYSAFILLFMYLSYGVKVHRDLQFFFSEFSKSMPYIKAKR